MSELATNPLLSHPVFAPIVRDVQAGELGQRLSAYASARAKQSTTDVLADLGAPLIDFLLQLFGSEVDSVMATNERVGGADLDAWFLTLRFADGFVATVDLGTFLPATYPEDLEIRLEVSGTDAVIIAEPENVAVTVIGPGGIERDHSYTQSYHDDYRQFATTLVSATDSPTHRVITAARRSAETDAPASLAR